MPRFPGGRLAALLALSGALVAAQSACSNDPTSEEIDPASLASGITLSVGGPDSIHVTGTYTYGARFGGSYVWFNWWTRSCPTLTVASCTTTWIQASNITYPDAWSSQITQFLRFSCLPANQSFQVKVTAGSFGQPPQTGYKVTKLCGSNPYA